MKALLALLALLAAGCSAAAPASSGDPFSDEEARLRAEAALLSLADSIFAAARARDADRFAGYFSSRPGFVYLINTRRIDSREGLRAAFTAMLGRQQSFEPRWGARSVQVLTPAAGVLTGNFETQARRANGEAWEARGVVSFVAMLEPGGWRVVHWHTTE